jgi:hypothetical protein
VGRARGPRAAVIGLAQQAQPRRGQEPALGDQLAGVLEAGVQAAARSLFRNTTASVGVEPALVPPITRMSTPIFATALQVEARRHGVGQARAVQVDAIALGLHRRDQAARSSAE